MNIEPGKFYKGVQENVKFKVVSINEVSGEVFILVFDRTEWVGSSFIKKEDFLTYIVKG